MMVNRDFYGLRQMHLIAGCIRESSFYTPIRVMEWEEPDGIGTFWMMFLFYFMFFRSYQPSLFICLGIWRRNYSWQTCERVFKPRGSSDFSIICYITRKR